jgi:hypothetical protein
MSILAATAWERCLLIDGWLTRNEAATLHKLASKANGPIAEIGSWQGRSTAALALGSMAGSQQPVFAIDSFVGVPPLDRPTAGGQRPGWSSSSPELLRANLDRVGVNGLVQIIAKPSLEAVDEIPECSLLFIDGNHTYAAVKADLEAYLSKVALGGYVALHDCCESDPDVVRAADEMITACPDLWRPRWRADSMIVFERRNSIRRQVMLGFPGTMLCYGAAKGIKEATLGAHDVFDEQRGLGWDDMNQLWCHALNQARRSVVTHYAQLHSDITPAPGWIDLLIDELEDRQADFISATVALKDDQGLTSCGIGDTANSWQPFRRFTLRELHEMPETFSITDTPHPDRYLLHNSGCFVADLRNPLWRTVDASGCLVIDFGFPIRSRALPNGDFISERESEDWHFSRGMAQLGLKTLATRRVATIHFGQKGYRNDFPWGKLEHDVATQEKWGAK